LESHSKRGAQLAQACWRHVSIGQQLSVCGSLCEIYLNFRTLPLRALRRQRGSLAYDTGRQTRHFAVYFPPAGFRAVTWTQVCCYMFT